MVKRVLLASPRGYCAGVERAVDTVEQLLDLHGPPVYVRKQIVHNAHVVRDLEARGAIFVESEGEVPEGETVVLSAHGVAPSVHANARARGLNTIDATCPLVTKVHVQARRYAADGYTVLLIGHAGHEEVVGTMGEAPESTILVQSVEDADALELPADARVAYITQTTLSVDETGEIITALRRRFPEIHAPKKEDICYATSNRQWAVKDLARRGRPAARDRVAELVELEPARRGCAGARCGGAADRRRDGHRRSVARRGGDGRAHVRRVCSGEARRARVRLVPGPRRRRDLGARLVQEDVEFRLPVELRRELALAETQS